MLSQTDLYNNKLSLFPMSETQLNKTQLFPYLSCLLADPIRLIIANSNVISDHYH